MGSCGESKSESSRSGSQLQLFQGQSGVLCGGCLKQGGQLPSKQVEEEPPRDWVLGPVRVNCSRAETNGQWSSDQGRGGKPYKPPG